MILNYMLCTWVSCTGIVPLDTIVISLDL
uniref:Uncharacterized protein n=1 Tax=Anguilla anguilla TaxID=7936 RepID=A0A0E9R3G5_ANGAN